MINTIKNLFAGLFRLGRYETRRISEASGEWITGRTKSSAGAYVSEEGSLSLSAVFAGVNLLSSVIAALPLTVYRRQDRSRLPATTHPAYRILGSQPNPEMTAFAFRRTLEFHRLLWGNCYAEIQWRGSGSVAALWPIEPWRVRPDRDESGRLYYVVDGQRRLQPEDILHVQLISGDGVCGRSFIDYALESLGLGMATQEFASRYFGNGARPGAVLTHPGNPNKQQRDEFRQSWERRHQGPEKAHGTAVLWGGWDYKPDGGFDAEKSQLLEQRRFTIEEVARWLNIPPHLLRDLSRATFSNIEHQGIDFVTYSINPSLVGYEQEYDRKLLYAPNLYSKHSVNGLLRGDAAARSAFYREMLNTGVLAINEVRELEDLNPIEGGDVHFVPLNMVPLQTALESPSKAKEATPSPPTVETPTQTPTGG